MNILIASGNPYERQHMRRALSQIGYQNFGEVMSAKDAFTVIAEHNIDLIVLGWSLQDMTGIEFTTRLRTLKSHAHLPVLLVTSRRLQEDILAAMRGGVDGYLVKPFTSDKLVAKLQQVLGKVSA